MLTLYPNTIGDIVETINRIIIPIAGMFLFRSITSLYTNIYTPDDI
ncbi:MAG: hypothetical protein KAW45_00245 [Thermoplasmatales archaeon]|nr:hypothetical protein [Thermoplasmatales archaeon]